MILMSSGKARSVSAKKLKAEVDALLSQTKAAMAKRKKPAAKPKAAPMPKPAKPAAPAPKPAPKPVAKAKPMSRGARLRQAEAQVKSAKPRDRRLCWSDMKTD